MNAAMTGLTEAVRKNGQSVSEPCPEEMRVGKPEPCAPIKNSDDWDFTFNEYAGTIDPAYRTLLKTARQSATAVMATASHEQQSATLTVPSHAGHSERSAEDREESWKRRFRSLQTVVPGARNIRSREQHGTARADHDMYGTSVCTPSAVSGLCIGVVTVDRKKLSGCEVHQLPCICDVSLFAAPYASAMFFFPLRVLWFALA